MRDVLLTGGTGVIGSALVPRLLECADVRLTLLLRAESESHLNDRGRELLHFCDVAESAVQERVRFVAGDVCKPNLGLAPEAHNWLTRNLTAVIHSAGNVKLNQPLDIARKNACQPISEVLALARSCRNLRKVDVVTTIGVAGRMPGVVPERRLTEQRQFHNTYEQAKAEAEDILWCAIDEGVPITIHRPSMVVGDSRTGKVASFQVFYYLTKFFRGENTWGLLPRLDGATLDIVPVDYVADAIALASKKGIGVGETWHLCSGPEFTLDLPALRHMLANWASCRGQGVRTTRELPRWCFRVGAKVAAAVTRGRVQRVLHGLPFFLEYMDIQQSFSNASTRSVLSASGIDLPSPANYLNTVLDYHWNSTKHRAREPQSQPAKLHRLRSAPAKS